jgi:hypothetical protein
MLTRMEGDLITYPCLTPLPSKTDKVVERWTSISGRQEGASEFWITSNEFAENEAAFICEREWISPILLRPKRAILQPP